MQTNNKPLCINCKYNPSQAKCNKVDAGIKNGDVYPKVFDCASYKKVSFYVFQTENYYGKFHTEGA